MTRSVSILSLTAALLSATVCVLLPSNRQQSAGAEPPGETKSLQGDNAKADAKGKVPHVPAAAPIVKVSMSLPEGLPQLRGVVRPEIHMYYASDSKHVFPF